MYVQMFKSKFRLIYPIESIEVAMTCPIALKVSLEYSLHPNLQNSFTVCYNKNGYFLQSFSLECKRKQHSNVSNLRKYFWCNKLSMWLIPESQLILYTHIYAHSYNCSQEENFFQSTYQELVIWRL